MAKQKDRGLRRGQGYVERRLGKDGDVFFVARWPVGDRYRSKVFRSADEREALERAEQHIRDMTAARRHHVVEALDMTVEDAINQYLERRQRDWKEGTYLTYVRRANSYILPYIGKARLVDLTKPQLQHWIDTLRREGRASETIYAASAVVTSSMREAARLGLLIGENPATGLRLPKIPRPDHHTWTIAEIRQVLTTVADLPMWHALYRLVVVTGMRPGEVRALRWEDVDLERGRITVARTMTKNEMGREVVGTSTKGGDARMVAVPGTAVAALRTWRLEQKVERIAAKRWTDSGHVFTSRHGHELSASVWQRAHVAFCEAAGVPVITLHELRHTHATLELEAGTHPEIVQDRLGHKRIQTTLDTYSHVSDDLQRAAAEAFDERLSSTTTSDPEAEKNG